MMDPVVRNLMSRMGAPSTVLGHYSTDDLKRVREYLKSSDGRNALRAGIDTLVIKTKNPNMTASVTPHQDLLQVLMHSMSTRQEKFNQDAIATDASNVPESYSGFNAEDYTNG